MNKYKYKQQIGFPDGHPPYYEPLNPVLMFAGAHCQLSSVFPTSNTLPGHLEHTR